MRVFAIVLVLLAGIAWFVQRSYKATPEKAMKQLEGAKGTGRLMVQPPVTIERFEVGEDFRVTVHLPLGALPGFSDAEQISLKDLAGKVCSVIGKRVEVEFRRGDQKFVVKP